jgi:hypothetical protein
VAYPHIMTNGTFMVAPPLKKFGIVFGIQAVMYPAVGHVVLGYAPFGMVTRINANTIGDGAILADFRVNDLHIACRITIIAEGGFNQPGICAKRRPGAYGTVPYVAGGVDIRLLPELLTYFRFSNRRKVFKIWHLEKL